MRSRTRWTLLACALLGLLLWLVLHERAGPAPAVADARAGARTAPEPGLRGAGGGAGETAAARQAGTAGQGPVDGAEADARPRPEASPAPQIAVVLDTVDAHTGRYVRARWNRSRDSVLDRIQQEALGPEAWARAVAAWEAAFVATGDAQEGAWRDRGLWFVLEPSAGWVQDGTGVHMAGEVAHGVTRLRWIEPLWREAVLGVRVFGPEGRPLAGARLENLVAAGRWRRVTVVSEAPGVLRVHGIPHMPGETVALRVAWSEDGGVPGEDEEIVEEASRELEEGVLDNPHVQTTIPHDLADPWVVEVHLKNLEAGITDSMETDEEIAYEEVLEETPDTGEATASVHVTVLDWQGRAVPGAALAGTSSSVASTDAAGKATLQGLEPGRTAFYAAAPGRFPMVGELVLRAGAAHELTLREPAGAELDVRVVDEQGAPRPSARLSLRGALCFDVEDGVQRMDPYTDHRGRRRLARVQPGRVTVFASWGSRSGRTAVTLVDGRHASVRVVVR